MKTQDIEASRDDDYFDLSESEVTKTYHKSKNAEDIQKIRRKKIRYKLRARRDQIINDELSDEEDSEEYEAEEDEQHEAFQESSNNNNTELNNNAELNNEQISEDEEPVEKTNAQKGKRKFSKKMHNTERTQEQKRRRRAYKNKTKLQNEETNDVLEENAQKGKVKIRNSPRLLYETLYYLTEDQREWVKKAGFESVLEFDLEMLPSKLSSKVLQVFDHNSVSLKLKNGNIYIIEEDVYDVIGLPFGGKHITLKVNESTTERMKRWLAQFPNEQITTAKVVEKIKESGVTEIFKMNFLIILSNVLIGTRTNSYVDRQLIRFDDDFDRCCDYNWAEYLLTYLVSAKESWNRTSSEFFRGPLIFLTLFYVDRVRYKGKKLVERHFPTYKGWTEEKLKERQAIEVIQGLFGSGSILPPLREVFSQDTEPVKSQSPNKEPQEWQGWQPDSQENDNDCDQWQSWQPDYQGWQSENNDYQKKDQNNDFIQKEQQNDENHQSPNLYNINDDNVQDSKKDQHSHNDDVQEEDLVEMLRVRATDIISAKIQFETDILKAQEKYPDNQDLRHIVDLFSEVFTTNKKDDDSQKQNDNIPDTHDVTEDLDLQPEHVAHLDLLEYLHSKQAILDMPDLFPTESKEDDLAPSFSLGIENDEIISQVCDDINKEHQNTHQEENEETDDFVTPKAAQRQKSSREIKVGPYSRSPYIERVIDVTESYTYQDIALWRYMNLQTDLLEEVFVWKGVKCIREHIQTLKSNTCLFYSVIDTWTTILNDGENYKANESPLRLFCTICDLTWSLDTKKSVHATYPIFSQNMDDILRRYPKRRLQDIDMVIFPINAYEHFYMISYNLKNPAYEIIDNIKREDKSAKYYGKIPNILHSHFVKYLKDKTLQSLAKTIQKLKPTCLSMQWQTEHNSKDCGIFLMRHMETYRGDARNWESKFKTEASGRQDHQIIRLRTKYNNAILSSHLNEKRNEILEEAKQIYNKDAEQRLFTLVREASGRKSDNRESNRQKMKQGEAVNKKTVTFASQLTTTFEEVVEED